MIYYCMKGKVLNKNFEPDDQSSWITILMNAAHWWGWVAGIEVKKPENNF